MEKKHELDNTLVNLKDFKKELENYDAPENVGGWSLSNLPTHFWETLGECITDIEQYIKTHKDNKNEELEYFQNKLKETMGKGLPKKYLETTELGDVDKEYESRFRERIKKMIDDSNLTEYQLEIRTRLREKFNDLQIEIGRGDRLMVNGVVITGGVLIYDVRNRKDYDNDIKFFSDEIKRQYLDRRKYCL